MGVMTRVDVRRLSEKTFENYVKAFLDSQDVWYLKVWGNGVQRSGIPDLLICCNGFFMGVELKAVGGKATKLQTHEIRKIRESNGFAFVLSPSEFEDFKQMILRLKTEKRELKNEYAVFPQSYRDLWKLPAEVQVPLP